ncbi:MAG: preprotein translocase subunit SecY [Candidatus Komeilibacteria bacterium RIFCSPLOWO2_01_FULL_52_15]|uniref:Protein translocase subunit SecY n=2 Tax=Candidatus Komeiliibacteriota TaxID=1817908 RepID=A0A1G2BQA1_9BACT|nr:MAG: preprotein translocase subunit SecY [Candidatus Komeilibacteria bacterium RIFCSPHIGHO2_01_FULL_52_14]OGY91006.1 MAG: preprotein translocase subunit SecY [Candidatus Komeilibacteria bacterium RIFCSPLOWO2_01_FULL_52_15]
MFEKLKQIWQAPDIRKRILFVLAMLIVFRIAAHIPLPGIDASQLKNFFASNQLFGLLNLFSGGGLENFSIVMMGVGPYITASIILQLLTMIVPKLEAISKEGESGQERINQYTRILTFPLALIQSYGYIVILQQQSQVNIVGSLTGFQLFSAMLASTAGTIFLMWIGELISEKKVGNGISLMIFANIIAQLPTAVRNTVAIFDSSQFINLLIFAAIALVTIVAIVFITEGQRNIPISFARQITGNRSMGGVNTHLPLRVNQAGVIPIIFAISVILFPPMIARFFQFAPTAWVANSANFIIQLFANQTFYGIFYFFMVFLFTYFYTAVIFKPEQIAENLQKQGGFIPGIRPGRHTEEYLGATMNRIILAGAIFLGLIAVLPITVQALTGIQTLAIGGTSLLIVVSVVIETVKQIDSQLVMRDYEGI